MAWVAASGVRPKMLSEKRRRISGRRSVNHCCEVVTALPQPEAGRGPVAVGEAQRVEQGVGRDFGFVVVVAGDALGAGGKDEEEKREGEESIAAGYGHRWSLIFSFMLFGDEMENSKDEMMVDSRGRRIEILTRLR